MASMEDLIATISGGMHVSQQGADLKDLHAKLAQTLHPTIPTYRPIPPQTTTILSPSVPLPPPAPASSWNDPVSQTQGNGIHRQNGSQMVAKRETGFSIPPPRQEEAANGSGGGGGAGDGGGMPYHAAVLPVRASPKDTGGFGEDAFRPLWRKEGENGWNGFSEGDRR